MHLYVMEQKKENMNAKTWTFDYIHVHPIWPWLKKTFVSITKSVYIISKYKINLFVMKSLYDLHIQL